MDPNAPRREAAGDAGPVAAALGLEVRGPGPGATGRRTPRGQDQLSGKRAVLEARPDLARTVKVPRQKLDGEKREALFKPLFFHFNSQCFQSFKLQCTICTRLAILFIILCI